MEKCMICEGEVEPREWEASIIDRGIIGERIEIRGHAKCLYNVTARIIGPSRKELKRTLRPFKKLFDLVLQIQLEEEQAQGTA